MELDTYMRFVLALLFVLALIGVVAWLARKAGLGTRVVRAKGVGRRLSIVEVSPVDGKRRLILVRRDGIEHLVLLGATGETVIETGIAPPAGVGTAPNTAPNTAPDSAPDSASASAISFKSQLRSRMGRASRRRGDAAVKGAGS